MEAPDGSPHGPERWAVPSNLPESPGLLPEFPIVMGTKGEPGCRHSALRGGRREQRRPLRDRRSRGTGK